MEEAAHKLVVHSLFSKDSPQGHIRDYFRKLEEANKNKGQQSEYAKQYAWVPPGLQQGVVSVTLELSSPQFICKREQNYLKLFEPVALRSDMKDISALYHISIQHIFKMKGDERKLECQLHKHVNGIIIQFLLTLTKYHFSFLTPNILLVLLLTVCHTILIMSVWRIWYWIN